MTVRRSDRPLDDSELPDEIDIDDGSQPLINCPNCHLPILEDAPQCPHCHHWTTSGPETWGPPRWYHRHGLWAVRTILMNWLWWLVLGMLGALFWLIR